VKSITKIKAGRTKIHMIKLALFCKRKISLAQGIVDGKSILFIAEKVDEFFSLPQAKLLKDGRSSTVIKIRSTRGDFVVRRDGFVNIIKFLKRPFKKSRSRKVWEKGQFLSSLGLNTIRPLALVEDFKVLFPVKSYVVYEYLSGTTLQEYLSNPNIPVLAKQKIAEKVVETISNWHSMGITHGDPKAGNIIINGDDVYLIDTEDIKTPQNNWLKRHAITRDKCILLHNFQKYQGLRDKFITQFVRDYGYGLRYFSKRLVKKFWKDEYAILPSGHLKRVEGDGIIQKIVKKEPLKDWSRLGSASNNLCFFSKKDSVLCFITPRAFYFAKSVRDYFKKQRVPKCGVLSIAIALRICGFRIPDIIDSGIHKGYEYIFVAQKEGRSLEEIWEKIKNKPFEKKDLIIALGEEIGRLHAMGFVGVISTVDDIYIKSENDKILVGFKINGNIRRLQRGGPKYFAKEIKMFSDKFISKISDEEASLFRFKYKEIFDRR
jgi:tRNA A-37 threonylcarbamoyl transferase component Bud32